MGKPIYTSANTVLDLGGIPGTEEIERLIKYYPTYKYVHRMALLTGMLVGKSNEDILIAKLNAKGIPEPISGRSRDGHEKWVSAKMRKTVIRFLYLRYRLKPMTRRHANQKVIKQVKFLGKSSIRKATYSPVLDC